MGSGHQWKLWSSSLLWSAELGQEHASTTSRDHVRISQIRKMARSSRATFRSRVPRVGEELHEGQAADMTAERVPAPVQLKYRAFLSYAHADTRWAKWLHGRLEGFRIDKDLVGRETDLGPVPKTLRPIFRDREDFSGGHTLTDATVAALDASAALIVLCSTVSAGRPAVNEEVRLFRSRHPERPVIPVIVDGTYPDNFPPALRFEVTPEGEITDRRVTLLGADLHEAADGKSLGLAKVVAGLTGVPVDDIFRRAERARQRAARFRNGVIALILALMGLGGFLAYRSHQAETELAERQKTIREIEAIVAKYGGAANAPAPGAQQKLGEAITAIASGAATDARYAKALELIKAGKPAEAEPLLRAVAEERASRAKTEAKQAAEAFRNLGAIAGLADPRRAREAYRRAAELDPDNIDALLWLGWLEMQAGSLEASERAYRRLIELHAKTPDSREVYWARLGLGNIRKVRGDLTAAKAAYLQAQAVADRLAKANPGDAGWQRDLSLSHEQIGAVLQNEGNLPGALASYRASFAIAERLAKADPGNAGWQSDLSVSLIQIGDVQLDQGNLPGALESYRASLAIAERLAKADPGNARWQHDLSVSHERIGDVLRAQGNLPGALESYRASLAIRERLTKTDPDNAGWQNDLSVSLNKIGDVLRDQGNLPGAQESYRASLAIAERLAKADPGNAGWQHDLALSHGRVAMVLAHQGAHSEAALAFGQGRAIIVRLQQLSPDNATLPRDLAWFEAQLAALK